MVAKGRGYILVLFGFLLDVADSLGDLLERVLVVGVGHLKVWHGCESRGGG